MPEDNNQQKRDEIQERRDVRQEEREVKKADRDEAQTISITQIKDDIKYLKIDVGRILAQTTLTNGKMAEIQKWKERITGGMIVINVIVLPVVMFLFYQYLTKK
jgi:hypothetical protein